MGSRASRCVLLLVAVQVGAPMEATPSTPAAAEPVAEEDALLWGIEGTDGGVYAAYGELNSASLLHPERAQLALAAAWILPHPLGAFMTRALGTALQRRGAQAMVLAALAGGYAARMLGWKRGVEPYAMLHSAHGGSREGELWNAREVQDSGSVERGKDSGGGPHGVLPPTDLLEEEREDFLSRGIHLGSLGVTLEQGKERGLYVDRVLRQGAAHRYRKLQVEDEVLALRVDSGAWHDLSHLSVEEVEPLLWAPFSSTFHLKLKRTAQRSHASIDEPSAAEELMLEVAVPSLPLDYKSSHLTQGDVIAVLSFFITHHLEGGSLQKVLTKSFITSWVKRYLFHQSDHGVHVTDDVLREAYLKARIPHGLFVAEPSEKFLGGYLLELIDYIAYDITDLYVREVWSYYNFVQRLLSGEGELDLEELQAWSEEPGEQQRLRKKLYKMALYLSAQHLGTLPSEKLSALLLKYARIDARKALALNQHDAYMGMLKAFAQSLDIHTHLLDAADLNDASRQKWGITLVEGPDYMQLSAITEHSVAWNSGLLAEGDRMKALRLESSEVWQKAEDLTLEDVEKILRSQEARQVQLRIQKAGTQQESLVMLKRERSAITQLYIEDRQSVPAYTWQIPRADYPHTHHRVGHVIIPQFFEATAQRAGVAQHVAHELQQLTEDGEGIDALLLDLRDNRGGEVGEVLKVANLFMRPQHMILEQPLYLVQRDLKVEELEGNIGGLSSSVYLADFLDLPVVVLVNARSVSGSELLAQAVQVHGRGVVVGGPRTYGKGTFTILSDLQDGEGGHLVLRLSAGRYHGADGTSVQLKGVAADVAIPSLESALALREEEQSPVISHKTLPLDFSAAYGMRDEGLLEALQQRSGVRLSQSDVFSLWQRIPFGGNVDDRLRKLAQLSAFSEIIDAKVVKGKMTYDEFFSSSGAVLDSEAAKEKVQGDEVLKEALQVTADYIELLRK